MHKADANPARRGHSSNFAISAFQRYAAQLRRYLGRRVLVSEDVDDLAQEVYLRLLRLEVPQQIQNPLAFIYTVAANVLCDYKAAARRESGSLTAESAVAREDLEQMSEALADRLEDNLIVRQEIEKALSELPATHAAVLILRERDGMSWEEVATKAKLSPHTVKKYLAEVRAMLRLKLVKPGEAFR
jgi:RNA polymerase sigma factor (sigma-70 family)